MRLPPRLRHDLDARLGGVVGIGHLEVRLAAGEEHAEDLDEVGVDGLERLEELATHLTVDGARDLLEGRARALEVRELGGDVVRTLLELRVLVHGHLVHGAEPVNLAAKRRNLALTGLAVLGLGHLEGLLEHMATVRGDGGNRLLHAHLELSGLDLEATLLGTWPARARR